MTAFVMLTGVGATDAQAWDWRPPQGEPVISLHFIDRLSPRPALLVLAGLRQAVAAAPAGLDLTGLSHGITLLDYELFDRNRDPVLASLRQLGLLVARHRHGELSMEHALALISVAGDYGFYPREWANAEAPAREAVAIARQLPGHQNHHAFPGLLDSLARILSELGHHAEAADLRREVLAFWQASPDVGPAVIQPRMMALVEELWLAERFDDAEVQMEEWLLLEYARQGHDPPEPVWPLLVEAAELASGNASDRLRAQALRAQAADRLEQTLVFLARYNPDTAPPWMNQLAAVLVSQGQSTQATDLYLQALAMRQWSLGRDHPAYRDQLRRTLAHLQAHDADHPERPAMEAAAREAANP